MIVKNSALETLRVQVAACTRIMNMDGLIDYSGHISARLPDGDGLLIQSFVVEYCLEQINYRIKHFIPLLSLLPCHDTFVSSLQE